MDILIISQYFWPENFRINDLAVSLKKRGHQITVLTGVPNYPGGRAYPGYKYYKIRREAYEAVHVIRVPLITRGEGSKIRLALNFFSFCVISTLLVPFLIRRRFDAILVYEPSPVTVGIPAIVLKKLRSIPIFFWVQDLWPEKLSATSIVRSEKILAAVRKLVKLIYSHCDRILVQSEAFIAPIEGLGISRERILYYPNSAEAFYQFPDTIDQPPVSMPEGFIIMFAGNIGAAQDFETILAGAQKVASYRDIHWVILGSGRLSGWVEAEVRKRCLSDNVHLLGRYPVELMPAFFAYADALLVTLRKAPIFSLTIPSKIQSYLACGKPIIAALDGIGARIIRDAGAGLACPPEDPKSLADAVLALYHTSPQERQEMGKRGQDYFALHFEQNMLLDRLEKWIHELTHRRGPILKNGPGEKE